MSTPSSSRTTPSTLNTDKTDKAIYDGAIPGMLHVLDPHSNFYDPKAFAQMREDQHGKYYGVGMTIQPQPDGSGNGKTKIVVLDPFEGTPAYKAGIRPGDVILSVDGKSTDGMDSAAVAALLKGPRHPRLGHHEPRRRCPSRWSSTSSATRFRAPRSISLS